METPLIDRGNSVRHRTAGRASIVLLDCPFFHPLVTHHAASDDSPPQVVLKPLLAETPVSDRADVCPYVRIDQHNPYDRANQSKQNNSYNRCEPYKCQKPHLFLNGDLFFGCVC